MLLRFRDLRVAIALAEAQALWNIKYTLYQ